MTNAIKFLVVVIIVFFILGYVLGRYGQPTKVVTKTEVITKTVTVDHVDTVTVIKEVTKPDGTKEVDTTVTDKSIINSRSDSSITQSQTITNSKPQWRVNALLAASNGPVAPLYGLGVERRILGPVWAGIHTNTDGVVGLSLGLEF